MTEAAVVVTGIPRFDESIAGLKVKVNAASRRIVERGGVLLASSAKRQFRGRPGGQRTSRTTGHIWYMFTPPYQAIPPKPTSRSGHLQSSINVLSVTALGSTGWMSTTGSRLNYAGYVEFGTRFMAKEPYLQAAADQTADQIQAIADDEYAKAMA